MTERSKRRWHDFREPFCTYSHGLGVALSVVGLIVLLILAHGRPWHIVSYAIYGATLIVLYTASTLYHSLQVKPAEIDKLRRFDHVAIFLLIAGTYTPVCLIALRGALGWTMLGIEYGLGATGIIGALLWKKMPDWLRIGIYVCMGWLIICAIVPASTLIPPAALWWLFAGGAAYSIGTVVFATNRPHLWPGKFSAHDLWHCFVLAGSVCHFVMMVFFALPIR